MNRSRIVSALLACLLVTGGVAGPMSQPAVAAEAGNCSDLDDFVMFATIGLVNTEDCSRQAYVQDAIADYEQTDAEQTKVDIYSEGKQVHQGAKSYRAPFRNYLQDSENVAWSKMQVAVASAYENNSTQSQARFEAEKSNEEYYSVKQRNLLAQWNQHVTAVERMHTNAEMETNVSSDFVTAYDNYNSENDLSGSGTTIEGFNTTNVTLLNGTSVEARVIEVNDPNSNSVSMTINSGTDGFNIRWVTVKPPTSSYNETMVMDRFEYTNLWDQITTQNSDLTSEAKTFVDATYSDFDNDTANASDVISANTAMFEYGTRSGDENESLYNTVGALSLMGFDTPNLNKSGTMTVGYNNQQYTGMVLARNAPNGTWESNTTYDTANISGPVFLATTDGEKIDLSGEFRINELRAKDGSSLNSTNTTNYVYKTANSSELMEMQKRLTSLRQEIEDREPSGGGGGSGGFGGNTMLIVLAALAAGAIALGSQNGGGRRDRRR